MRILLNGFERDVPAGMTVLELLEAEGEPLRQVLVDRNHVHVRPDEYARVVLVEGDRVEVVRPLFGG
ncbi:MAG: sulfur carrier protein ThiS [Planctomycetes bacterium]|nr:sulfur carrier protein ThiS [Planctomycetota bacterium]